MKANDSRPLRFRGSPRLLEGLAPLPFQEAVSSGLPLLSLRLSNRDTESEPLPLQASSAGESATRLGFSLPGHTPPGTYEGTVKLGANQYPAIIDVEARPSLVISPGRLSLNEAPGAEVSVDMTVVNSGNVVYEIQKTYKPGLLDVKGPERAIGVAMREKPKAAHEMGGLERLNLFAEELASGHAGQIDLTVQDGAGPLAPGELRQLEINMRLPDRLRPGRVYAGTLMLLNQSYYIEVHVSDGKGKPQGEKL